MATSKDVRLRFLLEAVDKAGSVLEAVGKKLSDTVNAAQQVGNAGKQAGDAAS